MSGQAVKGLQRLVGDRKIFIRDDREGLTVIMTRADARTRIGWTRSRKLESLPA